MLVTAGATSGVHKVWKHGTASHEPIHPTITHPAQVEVVDIPVTRKPKMVSLSNPCHHTVAQPAQHVVMMLGCLRSDLQLFGPSSLAFLQLFQENVREQLLEYLPSLPSKLHD